MYLRYLIRNSELLLIQKWRNNVQLRNFVNSSKFVYDGLSMKK